jgi:hypothetical protein
LTNIACSIDFVVVVIISYNVHFIFSDPFWCFLPTPSRRALIFPKGNNVDYLSMYLDVADSASLPYGWCTYAQFGMTLVNQIMNMFSLRKGSLFSLFLTVVTKWITMLVCWKSNAGNKRKECYNL